MPTEPLEFAHKIAIDSFTKTSWVYRGHNAQETKIKNLQQQNKGKIQPPKKKKRRKTTSKNNQYTPQTKNLQNLHS